MMRNFKPSFGMTLAASWLLSIVCLAITVAAEDGRRRNFMSSGPGSASMALGEALVSRGIDSSAGFYNPATLVGQPSGALLEYSQPNIDATRSWAAVAVGDTRLKTGILWKNETLPLSSNRNAFLLASGISDRLVPYLPRGMSLGSALGYVQQKITEYSASAFFASMGASYTRIGRKFEFGTGATLRNLYFSGLQFRDGGEKEVWPMEPQFGAYISRWGLTIYGSMTIEEGNSINAGVAYQPFPFIEFRAGMNNIPRLGLGMEIRKIRLDYAMALGDIKSAHSLTISYLWGKQDAEKDYTNPMVVLEAKYKAFPESILSEIKYKVQSGVEPELHDVLRLLATDLMSEDGWSFYTALTNEKSLKVKMPFRKRARRQYMEFAVAYANESGNAKELGEQFVVRFPREKVANFIRMVLSKDFNTR